MEILTIAYSALLPSLIVFLGTVNVYCFFLYYLPYVLLRCNAVNQRSFAAAQSSFIKFLGDEAACTQIHVSLLLNG